MQKTTASQPAAARRSRRLAPDSDEPLESLPDVIYPQRSNKRARKNRPSSPPSYHGQVQTAGLDSNSHAARGRHADAVPKITRRHAHDLPDPAGSEWQQDKEDMAVPASQISSYDRIKQQPRKASTRAYSNTTSTEQEPPLRPFRPSSTSQRPAVQQKAAAATTRSRSTLKRKASVRPRSASDRIAAGMAVGESKDDPVQTQDDGDEIVIANTSSVAPESLVAPGRVRTDVPASQSQSNPLYLLDGQDDISGRTSSSHSHPRHEKEWIADTVESRRERTASPEALRELREAFLRAKAAEQNRKRPAAADPTCDAPSLKSRRVTPRDGGNAGVSVGTPSVAASTEVVRLSRPQPSRLSEASSTVDSSRPFDSASSWSFPKGTTPATSPGSLDFSTPTDDDKTFIAKMKATLEKQAKRKTANVGKRQASRILDLLRKASFPSGTEALLASAEEAKAQLQSNKYFAGPIITQDQQPLELQTIGDFLDDLYDDNVTVFVQDAGAKLDENISSTKVITIGALKELFRKGRVSVPYNCLEMAAHVEDGLRPAFLNIRDCQLLTKLKHPSSDDQASRRRYEPGWKEVEKWTLLAKAGALTEPHQDSHGYSTYITVNEGVIGFGWLSNPSKEQRAAWIKNPSKFIDGQWRYVVLRPGHTIYFPAGTVHFVFRLAAGGDTLAFGGHVLRCSQIVRWVETLLEEKANPEVTNEDLSVSAPEYLKRVEKFVLQARKTGQQEKWGGEEGIERFLELKAEFLKDDGED